MASRRGSVGWLILAAAVVVALAGCQQQMAYQPSYKPQDGSELFADGRAARPVVANTVYRGNLREDDALWTGKVNGKEVEKFPISITQEVIERGQQRFNIYCQPCHGRLGDGNGMVVQRGVSRPPSYTDDRLLTAPAGHIFDVITNGWGRMYPYDHISVRDRWAIVSYVKALQLSQKATINEVPENERADLQKKDNDPPALHAMVQQTLLIDNKGRATGKAPGGHE
ncbi:MAG: c-type cytochrome [Candidatus Sumerlaeaceae bacterium]